MDRLFLYQHRLDGKIIFIGIAYEESAAKDLEQHSRYHLWKRTVRDRLDDVTVEFLPTPETTLEEIIVRQKKLVATLKPVGNPKIDSRDKEALENVDVEMNHYEQYKEKMIESILNRAPKNVMLRHSSGSLFTGFERAAAHFNVPVPTLVDAILNDDSEWDMEKTNTRLLSDYRKAEKILTDHTDDCDWYSLTNKDAMLDIYSDHSPVSFIKKRSLEDSYKLLLGGKRNGNNE